MKNKRLLSILPAAALMLSLLISVPAEAAGIKSAGETAAQALFDIGLFRGVGTDPDKPDFDLKRAPSRMEGLVMLVRLMGAEDRALKSNYSCPFGDVPSWAAPYAAYAYTVGWTKGVTETPPLLYDPDTTMTATQYLTFALRALGYADGVDFLWNAAWVLTDKLGITGNGFDASRGSLLRGDMAAVSLLALTTPMKNSEKTLLTNLIETGVFTSLDSEGRITDREMQRAIRSADLKSMIAVIGDAVGKSAAEVKNLLASDDKPSGGSTLTDVFYVVNHNDGLNIGGALTRLIGADGKEQIADVDKWFDYKNSVTVAVNGTNTVQNAMAGCVYLANKSGGAGGLTLDKLEGSGNKLSGVFAAGKNKTAVTGLPSNLFADDNTVFVEVETGKVYSGIRNLPDNISFTKGAYVTSRNNSNLLTAVFMDGAAVYGVNIEFYVNDCERYYAESSGVNEVVYRYTVWTDGKEVTDFSVSADAHRRIRTGREGLYRAAKLTSSGAADEINPIASGFNDKSNLKVVTYCSGSVIRLTDDVTFELTGSTVYLLTDFTKDGNPVSVVSRDYIYEGSSEYPVYVRAADGNRADYVYICRFDPTAHTPLPIGVASEFYISDSDNFYREDNSVTGTLYYYSIWVNGIRVPAFAVTPEMHSYISDSARREGVYESVRRNSSGAVEYLYETAAGFRTGKNLNRATSCQGNILYLSGGSSYELTGSTVYLLTDFTKAGNPTEVVDRTRIIIESDMSMIYVQGDGRGRAECVYICNFRP